MVRCGVFAANHGRPSARFPSKWLTPRGFGERQPTVFVVVGCEFGAANQELHSEPRFKAARLRMLISRNETTWGELPPRIAVVVGCKEG